MVSDYDRSSPTPHTEWRQGDFALDVGPFLFGDLPKEADEGGIAAFFDDADPAGFVVVSQTCDIVSDPKKLARVAVCPLVKVDARRIDEIFRGRVPRLGFVEQAPEGLVADLAQPMTITKQLLSSWKRMLGFTDKNKALAFARSLERIVGRFAFPTAFNESIRPLERKIKSKYGKIDSPLGKALRSLVELRVRPFPSWESQQVQIQFLLIVAPKDKRLLSPDLIRDNFEATLEDLPWQGGFNIDDPSVRIGDYDDFLARDYIESFPLDMNALSFAASYAKDDEDGGTA